jgi:cell division protease FtsH
MNSKQNKPGTDPGNIWKKRGGTFTFWALILMIMIFLAKAFDNEPTETRLSYSDYRVLLLGEEQKIASIKIITDSVSPELHGELLEEEIIATQFGTHTYKEFIVTLPADLSSEMELWESHGIPYDFEERKTNWLAYLLTSILPWILIIGVWLFIMRRMQGGGNGKGVFSFGKSKAKMMDENQVKVNFSDVAGADEAKEELMEIIEFLKDPKKFSRLGGRIPKGALMLGPPGTGKTLLAKAVAGEAQVPFYSMSGADFVEMFVGVGASRVRDLFEQGKKNAPCILFIDEIDAVGRQRGAGLGGGHDEREQTLNQLLVEMDGFESNEGVILIAATNRPDVLDPALMRPGRFDRQIVVDRPDVRGREGILKVHTKKVPLDDDVKLGVVAKGTPGLAGAELANIVNEAALLAARGGKTKVDMSDFEEARDKVLMGSARKSLLITEEDKKVTAYHEAGHALIGWLLPEADQIHKVTIIPRGRALGLTWQLPDDKLHTTEAQFLARIRVYFGGREAENMVFSAATAGAYDDIRQATKLAQTLVCDLGMSEKLGLRNYGKKQEEIFIGREISQHRDFSEQTAILIDEEINRILEEARTEAIKILQENRQLLDNLAKSLLNNEILDADDIAAVMNGDVEIVENRKNNPDNSSKDTVSESAQEEAGTTVSETKEVDTAGDADPAVA